MQNPRGAKGFVMATTKQEAEAVERKLRPVYGKIKYCILVLHGLQLVITY